MIWVRSTLGGIASVTILIGAFLLYGYVRAWADTIKSFREGYGIGLPSVAIRFMASARV
jgi:hypothetical protein